MNYLKQQFVDSWHELKHLKVLAITAIFIAIGVILGFMFTIQFSQFIKIGFSSIPNELTALFFGPVVGGIMGGITDVLKYLIKPTGPFFFGFTLNAMLGPVIYGIFLYQQTISMKRILAAHIVVALFVNLLLGTWWLTLMYGKSFIVLLPVRAFKQLISVPIDSMIFYFVAKRVEKQIYLFRV